MPCNAPESGNGFGRQAKTRSSFKLPSLDLELNWRAQGIPPAMTPAADEPFGLLRTALESAGIRFAVGGSWASAAYGDARFDAVRFPRKTSYLPNCTGSGRLVKCLRRNGATSKGSCARTLNLDRAYLERGAAKLRVESLLNRAMETADDISFSRLPANIP